MKLFKTKASIVIAVLTLTSFVATAAFVNEVSQTKQLERAVRMSNISILAINNDNYDLACKAQREVADAIVDANAQGIDLYSSASQFNRDFCFKAQHIAVK